MLERRRGAVPQFTEMRRPALWDDAFRRVPAAPRTVVVGYDGSQAARRALRCAAEAARAGGHVVVVTATQHPDAVASEGVGGRTVAEPARLLEEAVAELMVHGVNISTRIEESEPAEALAEAARQVDAALIVVGARGDNFVARALRGSVAEKLIARAPCDLLVAR
jgi:nucleotide-binding universal stress UspA family protein